MQESETPFFESARSHSKIVGDLLISSSLWKSGSIKELTSFDCRILLEMPKGQAELCYGGLFNSFSDRGWVAEYMKTVYIEV